MQKSLDKMSNYLRPSCRLLNQSNFFLLERAKSELQILYQTYFPRTNLRRRKSQKPNTSKKSCNFFQLENSVFLNYFELHRSELEQKIHQNVAHQELYRYATLVKFLDPFLIF